MKDGENTSSNHITPEEYKNILKQQEEGKIVLHIDTTSFRDHFSTINSEFALKQYGEKFSKEIKTIKIIPTIEISLLLTSILFAILATGWYSILLIIGILLSYARIKGKASYGIHEIKSPIMLLLLVFFLILLYDITLWASVLLINLALLYFIMKFYYYIVAKFTFDIIHRNYKFFKLFYNLQSFYYPEPVKIPFLWSEKL